MRLSKAENLHKKSSKIESMRVEFMGKNSLKWIQGESLRSAIGRAFAIIVNMYIKKKTIS